MMQNKQHDLHTIPNKILVTGLAVMFAVIGVVYMTGQGFKFDSAQAFFDMGGRALFVWLSFGVGLCAMLAVLAYSIFMNGIVKREVTKQHRRAQRIIEARKNRKKSKEVADEPST
ncbi:heme exporter protein CcmD [Agaribacter flavus]|uniref:Heme exporter protein D n=1 Tax=Agaribacter flavus TaxID=1902781 RepID=A0ABV7FRX0_9ALTE